MVRQLKNSHQRGLSAMSIQIKLTIVLLTITTGILAGYGVYQYIDRKKSLTEDLVSLAETTTIRMASSLGLPIWEVNTAAIEETVLSEMQEKRFYAVIVKDQYGDTLLRKMRDTEWQIVDAEEADMIIDTNLSASQEIVYEYRGTAKTMGTIEVYLTPRFMALELRREIQKIVIAVLFLDLTLLACLIPVLRKMMIEPITHLLGTVSAIAQGDFTQPIHIRQYDEIGRLSGMCVTMRDTIQQVMAELEHLSQSIRDGELDTRGNAQRFTGGWRDLIQGINSVIDAFVAPINVTAAYIEELSGDKIPDTITGEYRGDFNKIKSNLNLLGEKIRDVLTETETLNLAILEGRLNTRGSIDRFNGGWRVLIEGLNSVLDAFETPITTAATTINRIAQGDIPAKITQEYQGDFNTIKVNLNTLIETVENLLSETTRLILAIQEGQLRTRSDAERFVGDWRKLVHGMNGVLDAVEKPITTTAAVIERIARGDIPNTIANEYKGDFHQITQNVNMLIEATCEVTQVAKEMSEGNLLVEVRERSESDTLMQALNAMIQQVKGIVSSVKTATAEISLGSQDLSKGAESMSESANQQAAAMEEVSSSMEEMTANIRQNADNARQTEKIAIQSSEYTAETSKVVVETVLAMEQIATKIIIIQDIAMQTRLLSLNATIEASRAQEHGKAFSVVASEVRALSDVTKKAAEEINHLAVFSLDISKKAGEMLGILVPSIHRTSELVQEITAASNEQSQGASQINSALQQLDQVTQGYASTSEEMASMATELAIQAAHLQQTVEFFKLNDQEADQQHVVPPKEKNAEHPRWRTSKEETGERRDLRGYHLHLPTKEDVTDERDNEFEAY